MRRLRLLLTGTPGSGLTDVLRDSPPAGWDADDLQIGFFLCDLEDVTEEFDIDDIASLTLEVRASPSTAALLAGPIEPDDALEDCDRDDFDDDDGQHGTFTLSAEEMNVIASRKKVWMSVRAELDDGTFVTFGAGYVSITHSGHEVTEDPVESSTGGFLYIESLNEEDGTVTVRWRNTRGEFIINNIETVAGPALGGHLFIESLENDGTVTVRWRDKRGSFIINNLEEIE